MKKFLSVLLSITVLFSTTFINTAAKEKQTYFKVFLDSGNGKLSQKAIIKNNEIFIPAEDFTKITRYEYNQDEHCFLIKGQELKKSFKSILIDKEKKRMLVSKKQFFNLTDCFTQDETLFLPLCQMLPVLNADILNIKDNIIYIYNSKLTLADILYDFNVSDYYFEIVSEMNEDKFLALQLILPNFVLDTFLNDLFSLNIVTNKVDYNHTKEVLSEFITDKNLYLQAKAKDPSITQEIIDFFDKANETSKDLNSIYDWIDEAGKTTSKNNDVLFNALKDLYNTNALKDDNFKKLTNMWNSGEISFGDFIDICVFAYDSVTMIEDNKEMLNAVYNVKNTITKKETDRKAAKDVYDLYGENVESALVKEVINKLSDDAIATFLGAGLYNVVMKTASALIEGFLPFKSSEVAQLPYYSNISVTAAGKYAKYLLEERTDENIYNLRLSLLLCLTASKKGCEVLGDTLGKETKNFYKERISETEKLIMGLYKVGDNLKFDSFEHFDEFKEANLKKIKEANLLKNLEEYKITKSEATKIAKDLISRYETFENMGVVCDLEVTESFNEEKEIKKLLTEDQRAYLERPHKSTCCKTYAQAKKHKQSCIDDSVANYMSTDYAKYKGNLYFFMQNQGSVNYKDVSVKEYNENRIIAIADLYGSGDNYCGTYEFIITKKDDYKITSVNNINSNVVLDTEYFSDKKDWFSEGYFPYLILKANGNFILKENLGVGMGEYKGKYEIIKEYIYLTVESIDFKGFTGDTLKNITFIIKDVSTLEIATDLCFSKKGDLFKIN